MLNSVNSVLQLFAWGMDQKAMSECSCNFSVDYNLMHVSIEIEILYSGKFHMGLTCVFSAVAHNNKAFLM